MAQALAAAAAQRRQQTTMAKIIISETYRRSESELRRRVGRPDGRPVSLSVRPTGRLRRPRRLSANGSRLIVSAARETIVRSAPLRVSRRDTPLHPNSPERGARRRIDFSPPITYARERTLFCCRRSGHGRRQHRLCVQSCQPANR